MPIASRALARCKLRAPANLEATNERGGDDEGDDDGGGGGVRSPASCCR